MRADEVAGVEAADYTIRAAKFLAKHRNGYNLALNAQGSTAQQYLHCVQQIVPLLQPDDVIGLGGWCVLGRVPSLMADFLETLALVIPFCAQEESQKSSCVRLHIFSSLGGAPGNLRPLWHLDIYRLCGSPSFAPRIGKWGYGSWRRNAYRRTSGIAQLQRSIVPSWYTLSWYGVHTPRG